MQNLLILGQALGRSEMKKIMAGSGSFQCTKTVYCSDGSTCECSGAHCKDTASGCTATQEDGSIHTCDC